MANCAKNKLCSLLRQTDLGAAPLTKKKQELWN